MKNAKDDITLIPWSGRAIGLLDLDAFFASVEQLDHPEWRGKPLIVGGSSKRRGVVSTASYEARKFGVHSAMPSFLAERLCPQAIWTEGHFSRYHELSETVMNILVDETPLVEQVSIDEAFFDITPGRYAAENPVVICRRIQNRVEKLGISCSIGLGINKTIAKIASEREKPCGLTVVPPGTEALFLAPLPVRAMSGIGNKAEAKLQSLHIKTLGQLAQADPQQLRRMMGSYGPSLIKRAAGKEQSSVAERVMHEVPKSVSSERTFAHDLCDKKDVRAAVLHVAALTGTRLRKKRLKGSEVTLKLKFDFNKSHTIQRQLNRPTDDEHEFAQVALELLDQIWHEGSAIRLVGVGLSNFGTSKSQQLSLFEMQTDLKKDQHPTKKKRDLRRLALTTDELKSRFGNSVISYGHDLRLRGELDEKGRSQ